MNQEHEKVEEMPTVTDEQYRLMLENVPEKFRVVFDPAKSETHQVFIGHSSNGMSFLQRDDSEAQDGKH